MLVTQSSFDCETVALMGRVCDEVYREVQAKTFFCSPIATDVFHEQLAIRVMAAVAGGERDPKRLKAIAMDGLEA